ncbi:MAG TPA: hypothetical protein VHZ28_01235 [Terracidiphilus sp.]|jgi:hypothetical protein|nr:hypothetical protein [Terracidiphilus sp.]
MATPRFIDINGKKVLGSDVLELRRQQRIQAARATEQPTLFELHEDRRLPADRNAAGRYLEPTLFSLLE